MFLELCFTDPAGRPLRQSAVHRRLQEFLTDHRRGLVEMPRDHGKSTQVCARLAWELGHDPGLRIKIVCASDALAAERSRFLRSAIGTNAILRKVFPDLVPAGPWTDARFTVVRPANVIGPSVTAIGIGAASTGSRADLLVCDDIVDVKALHSRAERARVKDAFRNNLMNLLEPDGRFWGLCTPWHQDDLNADLKRSGAYPVFHEAVTADLGPVWPERWPREALEARRAEIGPASFARGYRLIPLAEADTPIRPEWVRVWDTPAPAERVVLSVDPAVATGPRADRSALVVLAVCGPEVRCLDATARRLGTPDLVQVIGELDRAWRPDVIVFEANAAFRGIADLLVRHAGFGGKVRSVVASRDKAWRTEVFSVPVRNGTFRLKGDGRGGVDPAQRELFEEMTTFPVAEHDDLLDAAATGTAYLLNTPEPRVW